MKQRAAAFAALFCAKLIFYVLLFYATKGIDTGYYVQKDTKGGDQMLKGNENVRTP